MSPKRLSTSEKEDEEEELYIPDELLGLIVCKITDPKTLLVSFLVSKRFASILSQSQSLSLQFPTHLSFPKPFPPLSDRTKYSGDLFLRLRNLLLIFNRVQSLHIELPCCCNCPDDTVFKWKAKTGVRCGIVCFLAAKSVSKIDDKKRRSRRGRTARADDTGWPYFYSLNAGMPYLYASAMHRLMQLLIWWHPNLECVELVDSKKHGKLSIGGEALIKWRTTMLDPTPKNMSKFITESPDRKGDGDGDDAALDGGFEDDEDGIFGEAMTRILTKRPPLRRSYF
ncbi:hypothetical protein Vadar_005666 [Vaccinium darrowii]|uniref:Uncharacterized protein n=1 Tax=Vaccinium darrowii TaxID=229202 RepID=A0ACB7WYA3_9ERIC|nr:hypothetical protein Vadar_005666 [Vaccinium darrowii]